MIIALLTSFLLSGVLPLRVGARVHQLPPRAKVLAQALAALRSNASDPAAQKQYLAAFPRDYKAFLELFDSGQPLYDVPGPEFCWTAHWEHLM